MDIGAGLAALAFWGFIGTCVMAGVWDNIRKRDAKHETLRKMMESSQPMDEEQLRRLGLLADDKDRPDRAFKIAGVWLISIAVGLAVLAVFLGFVEPIARTAVLGAAAMMGCMGVGALIGGFLTAPWYIKEGKD
tara:strand:+ start:876 stop:1277 length:402 start_codon:yes stop_codon:yes gene_type:complete